MTTSDVNRAVGRSIFLKNQSLKTNILKTLRDQYFRGDKQTPQIYSENIKMIAIPNNQGNIEDNSTAERCERVCPFLVQEKCILSERLRANPTCINKPHVKNYESCPRYSFVKGTPTREIPPPITYPEPQNIDLNRILSLV